jgi:hypothetical protein
VLSAGAMVSARRRPSVNGAAVSPGSISGETGIALNRASGDFTCLHTRKNT